MSMAAMEKTPFYPSDQAIQEGVKNYLQESTQGQPFLSKYLQECFLNDDILSSLAQLMLNNLVMIAA